jgi:hypothetical protein
MNPGGKPVSSQNKSLRFKKKRRPRRKIKTTDQVN